MIAFEKLVELKVILCESANIKDCIESLDKSKMQIVLISKKNNNRKIIGTVTDGDIRRSFINGFDINTNVNKIIRNKYYYSNKKISFEEAKKIMKKRVIKHLPILDDKKRLHGLYCQDYETSNFRKNIFFIMAGGYGKRMLPFTKETPKPMLKINGKPILYYIIKNAIKSGFSNFVISTHYKSKVIMDYFKDGKKLNIRIEYINEKKPLGTAGSIKYLKNKTKLPFIVSNADMLTKLNYSDLLEFHEKNKSKATMAYRNYKFQNPYGVIKIKNSKVLEIIEKPIHNSFINTGLYVFDPIICKYIPNKHINMNDFIILLKQNKIFFNPFPLHEEWSDIGTKEEFRIIKNSKNI